MTAPTIAAPTLRPFPYVNPWRRGCWVARPTGADHPQYVYEAALVADVIDDLKIVRQSLFGR